MTCTPRWQPSSRARNPRSPRPQRRSRRSFRRTWRMQSSRACDGRPAGRARVASAVARGDTLRSGGEAPAMLRYPASWLLTSWTMLFHSHIGASIVFARVRPSSCATPCVSACPSGARGPRRPPHRDSARRHAHRPRRADRCRASGPAAAVRGSRPRDRAARGPHPLAEGRRQMSCAFHDALGVVARHRGRFVARCSSRHALLDVHQTPGRRRRSRRRRCRAAPRSAAVQANCSPSPSTPRRARRPCLRPCDPLGSSRVSRSPRR